MRGHCGVVLKDVGTPQPRSRACTPLCSALPCALLCSLPSCSLCPSVSRGALGISMERYFILSIQRNRGHELSIYASLLQQEQHLLHGHELALLYLAMPFPVSLVPCTAKPAPHRTAPAHMHAPVATCSIYRYWIGLG